jgi:hypothetical protein
MSIDDDWMVDLMIIYIEKTFVKALDINDIIKFFMGCHLDESKSLNKKIKFDHLLKFENKIYIGYFHILWSAPLGQSDGFAPAIGLIWRPKFKFLIVCSHRVDVGLMMPIGQNDLQP